MNAIIPQLNLSIAWLWLVLGVLSGLALGLFFHKEEWMGGYASFRRRLYRLGHISFFGLGLLNFMYYVTATSADLQPPPPPLAGWAFLVGAVTMPVCCFCVAHRPGWRLGFAIPVLSLLLACFLTLIAVLSTSL